MKRGRGEPRGRVPLDFGYDDRPRIRIVRAARRLFGWYGYNATTVREITWDAGMNVGAVNHYFRSKDNLYLHVLHLIVDKLPNRVEAAVRGRQPPLKKIEKVVRAFFAHIHVNPDMPAFMVREMATGEEPSQPIVDAMKRALAALVGTIKQGQANGTIRDADPTLLALTTIAQPVYLYLARGGIKAATGRDEIDLEVINHAVTMVRAALEKR